MNVYAQQAKDLFNNLDYANLPMVSPASPLCRLVATLGSMAAPLHPAIGPVSQVVSGFSLAVKKKTMTISHLGDDDQSKETIRTTYKWNKIEAAKVLVSAGLSAYDSVFAQAFLSISRLYAMCNLPAQQKLSKTGYMRVCIHVANLASCAATKLSWKYARQLKAAAMIGQGALELKDAYANYQTQTKSKTWAATLNKACNVAIGVLGAMRAWEGVKLAKSEINGAIASVKSWRSSASEVEAPVVEDVAQLEEATPAEPEVIEAENTEAEPQETVVEAEVQAEVVEAETTEVAPEVEVQAEAVEAEAPVEELQETAEVEAELDISALEQEEA